MASAFAIVFMVGGAGYAWGPGGAFFGLGLWISLACVGEVIETAILNATTGESGG